MNKTEYKLRDGGMITASSPEEFVETLKSGSLFDSENNAADYMAQFAQRYRIQTGVDIRSDTATNFLEDLKKTGYLV